MTYFFQHISHRLAGRIFCIIGGYCNTVVLLLLKGVFTASITGNIIKISVDMEVYNKCKSPIMIE
jgi:uncharacterized membrane protein YoaK (UPF0700 family)